MVALSPCGHFFHHLSIFPIELFDAALQRAWFVAPPTTEYVSNLVINLTVTDFGGLQSSAEIVVYVLAQSNVLDVEADENTGIGDEPMCFIKLCR